MDQNRTGAIVLCGGRSERMGRPKHLLPFGDECLLQRVVRILSGTVPTVVVVAARGQPLPALPDDVLISHDDEPNLGPLAGLLGGLRIAAPLADAVFLSSCDSPFLSTEFVSGMFNQLGDHDLSIVESGGHLHPLAAVYRTRLKDAIERLVESRRLRPIFLLEECASVVVGEQQARVFDPELRSLQNVNTPEAYRDALALAGLSEAGNE